MNEAIKLQSEATVGILPTTDTLEERKSESAHSVVDGESIDQNEHDQPNSVFSEGIDEITFNEILERLDP